jgi:uncharacterized GH25 family protein
MHSNSRRLWHLLTAGLALSLTTGLTAHDFWIEPSTFEPALGEAVEIRLRVGEHFLGEPVVRNSAKIERFVAAGPSGERSVIGREGRDPAGLLRVDEPGLWIVGYRSRSTALQLAAPAFEQYLREEGLERIIAERAARNESQAHGREQFSRSVKSLLRAGPSGASEGYDRVLGMTLELVPEASPFAAADGRLPIRLLHNGRPLAGALVVAYRKDSGKPGEGQAVFKDRTSAQGRVLVPVSVGIWLLKAVHMERTPPGSAAEWASVWTALTFRVPAR